jgi:hypothetical protein
LDAPPPLQYHRRILGSRRILGLYALATLFGCNPLKPSASISTTTDPAAVGAYWQVNLVAADILAGRWPIGPMTVTLSDPSVVRIVPDAEIPEAMSEPAEATLQALAVGETVLSMEADFDDGKHRRAETTIHTRVIDTVAISPVCDKQVDLPLRVPAGALFELDGVLKGGGQTLGGYYPGAFAGDGVACKAGGFPLGATDCWWTAPPAGGGVAISSPLDPAFSTQLQAYLPGEVTAVIADLSSGFYHFGTAGLGGGSLPAYVKIAGGRPCQPMGIAVTTLSPSICAGPAGETTWADGGLMNPSEVDKAEWVEYTSLAEGDCQLALGAAGAGTYPSVVHVPIRVATDVTASHAVGTYQACTTASAVTCHETFAGISVCNGKTWDEPQLCPRYQACEFLLPGTQGCKVSTGCARCR